MSLHVIRIVGEPAEKQGAGRVSGIASGKSVSAQAIAVTAGPPAGRRRSSCLRLRVCDRFSVEILPDPPSIAAMSQRLFTSV